MKTGLAEFIERRPAESPPIPIPPRAWRAQERLTLEEVSELITSYMAGTSTRDLENEFGLGKTAIVRLLRSHGVEIRRRGRRSRGIKAGEVWRGDPLA